MNDLHLKGKNAEEMVYELAKKSFLIDWCYPNPFFPDGKELCDLLVIFDDIAIIWQIKDLKLDGEGKYKKGEVDKNLRQLEGARRQLFDVQKPIELENSRRGKELFDPSKINHLYLISALLGEGEEMFSFVEEIKNRKVHIFTREFIQIVLGELDTISDFITYLSSKEKLIESQTMLIMGGEKELLGTYLLNDRKFDRFMGHTHVMLDEGMWESLQSRPEYQAKKKEDEISYAWDGIINSSHTSASHYEPIARELARPDRFKRRFLSKIFLDAHIFAEENSHQDIFRRLIADDGVTYCFLFMDLHPERNRSSVLEMTCIVARNIHSENRKVVGIATEMKINPICSYDFCLIDMPEITEEFKSQAKQIQQHFGIFVNPEVGEASDQEYPEITSESQSE